MEFAVCREAGARVSANVFLRDLDLPIGAMDQRRIEMRGSLFFTGLSCRSTVLTFARRRKEHTSPEHVGGRGRAKLVVVAGETERSFLAKKRRPFLRLLAEARTRSTPSTCARARQSWLHARQSGKIATRQASLMLGDFCRAPIEE